MSKNAQSGNSRSKSGKIGSELIQQLQARFVGLWQRLTEGETAEDETLAAEYLNSLKERAYLERTIANQYRGRYLLELVQNAVDSMHKQARLKKAKVATDDTAPRLRCHLELTEQSLYIANDGQPFDAADVRGVCAMGQSTKPAGEYIGYKGLGFRAVLEITDAPEIYSGDYAFGFSRAETLTLLGKTETEVAVLAVPHHRALAAASLPESEREVLARLKKAGFATIIRLPLKPTSAFGTSSYREVRDACSQILNTQTVLFLPYLSELSLAITPEGTLGTLYKTSREVAIRPDSLAEIVRVARLSFRQTETAWPPKGRKATNEQETIEDWLLVEPRQPSAVDRPELLAELDDPIWQTLKQVTMATAYPLARMPWGGSEVFLKRRKEPLPFFAHFPTQEGSGLGLAVQADFYLSASRKQIEETVAYNRWLTLKLVGFIAGPALEALHYLYPDEANLIELLVDYSYYTDSFGRAFRETLNNRLIATAFVPIGNSRYLPPARVVWTPLEQDGVLIFRRVFRYPGADLHYPVLQLEKVYATTSAQPAAEPLTSNGPVWRDEFDLDASSFKPAYSTYDYERNYDYDREQNNYTSYDDAVVTTKPKTEAEPEFEYARIRQFLSALGVKKLLPRQLAEFYGQALQNWQDEQILAGEVCASLALWYTELEREGQSRELIEQARNLPVLPTIGEGWKAPEDPRFIFTEASLADIELIGEAIVAIDGASQAGRRRVSISPEAYDLPEYSSIIRKWHEALGVRPR